MASYGSHPNTREQETKCLVCSYFYSGASRDRTGDLLLAKQALSQLSYGPVGGESSRGRGLLDDGGLAVEVEVARRALLEPQPIVLGRVLEELGCLLEYILARLRPGGIWD